MESIKEGPLDSSNIAAEGEVPHSRVNKAKEDLQILNIEKTIADQIVELVTNRLNEAKKEGQISNDVQTRVLERYVTDVVALEKKINQKEKIVSLYKLEKTQNSLIQSFNKKLEELNKEILDIRTSLGIEHKDELKMQLSKALHENVNPSQNEVSPEEEAEQKLETIQEDVLKIFEKIKPKSGTK